MMTHALIRTVHLCIVLVRGPQDHVIPTILFGSSWMVCQQMKRLRTYQTLDIFWCNFLTLYQDLGFDSRSTYITGAIHPSLSLSKGIHIYLTE